MTFLCIAAYAVAIISAESVGFKYSEIGTITCFADSAKGMKIAEIAAEFLNSQGQGNFYSKSYAVSDLEDKDSNRMLILVLSEEGEKEYKRSRSLFDQNILALLQKMQKFFEDNKVSVVLQSADKSNLAEALIDSQGSASIKNFPQPSPTTQ